jgi:heptosyltransferase-1
VANKWVELLEGNPQIDKIVTFERRGKGALRQSWRKLRLLRPEIAIDFQGLIQSALAGRATRPERFYGRDRSQTREPLAALFYTKPIKTTGPHSVEANLQLAAAAGAKQQTDQAWIPLGRPQGVLPERPFVLASPFAGWTGKQWPLENYGNLARELNAEGIELVVNVPPTFGEKLSAMPQLRIHESGLPGLIDATRRATAIVGVDSGPMHLAAALGKTGVAIFGPTDPARNGPFHSKLTVLRDANARTTYRRGDEIDPSMRAIGVEQVKEMLLQEIRSARVSV